MDHEENLIKKLLYLEFIEKVLKDDSENTKEEVK